MSQYQQSPVMGQMMSKPLLISSLIEHADRYFGSSEIVSRRVEGDIHRYNYRECHSRAKKLANALKQLDVKIGDRVATLAWNGYRHLEAYYAVSGSGAVLHTINPRLHPEQISYMVNHAEDQYLFFEINFLPIIKAIASHCPTIKGYIMMCSREHLPTDGAVPNLMCYEDLIDANSDDFVWPLFDENSASSLCYTSGTTGNPKGALYSHRSTVLHSYASAMPDGLNVSGRDCVLPVVPMFHVNAWGLPYSAPLTGAKLVFPGPALDGKSLYELFEQEQVTFSAGVPTVWLGLLTYVAQNNLKFSSFKRTVIGGSACPPAMMKTLRHTYGVEVVHAWGMTEMSPLGTTGTLMAKHSLLSDEAQQAILEKQGHVIYGVDMKIVDDAGKELPWDGKTYGNLLVKGPWIISSYYKHEGGDVLEDGWFPTGDVATIDADGYMQITDRSKDVIKSGGEWIGTIDLENVAMSHPAVLQAACIGIFHPKWDERPLLLVVKKPGAEIEKQELISFYEGKIAKWWMPDDVVFIDALPLGATGKILKNKLRDQFKDYQLPTA
ncbi:3-(methylthio)propionyl-CoA ligase [Undibacterium sp. RTI2.1]|uniref:3-(methylthio)propionyl-CoA ligase n=1 Tax=unclassified Undibacterium TaxID=2630295 RepID=UPI002AB5BCFE|nr:MULTISPECIES: 3-(methylthio)propionyl-CoA ligase [unclassified Undibacterium]MDY7538135.1 3-(methylthio)propionyl-CoA ligase [Undibacterium sp. 5I1]MEB0031641.1 3-(methylthio)propionyl-CoA ligase [Undibacterium sp. RTI2.1]MEB0116735.1 3-(methylthio)propionyl-CoA ligase [Undibacterium sp. RTI2.2]MEB0229538.1 3-(methylthio)propionyl-CoA ligase [Undibacterium sp. 10I3]MEB0257383.1 3-(methylthio)propionyl-CoA ligase [Undibacterium sp. 5I1]